MVSAFSNIKFSVDSLKKAAKIKYSLLNTKKPSTLNILNGIWSVNEQMQRVSKWMNHKYTLIINTPIIIDTVNYWLITLNKN